MAKEKRTSKAQEEMEQINSSCVSDCPSSSSSTSDSCGQISSDCQ